LPYKLITVKISDVSAHNLCGMVYPWVEDGGCGFQIWRVTANVLNRQSQTADKE
jgi:hypothetical protein